MSGFFYILKQVMEKVAIQGVDGAYHDIAIRKFFENEDVELICCDTFKQVFDSVKNADGILGIVAIENTIAGSLMQDFELLRTNDISILALYKNNLTKLQSLPIIGWEWEYIFYIDLTYDDSELYKQSLDAIRPLTMNLKILGEYQIGKQIK